MLLAGVVGRPELNDERARRLMAKLVRVDGICDRPEDLVEHPPEALGRRIDHRCNGGCGRF